MLFSFEYIQFRMIQGRIKEKENLMIHYVAKIACHNPPNTIFKKQL